MRRNTPLRNGDSLRYARVRLKTLLLALAFIVANVFCGRALAADLTTPYTDPAYLTRVPFGAHSQWIQPWRAYLETVPAADFVNGTGIVFNVGPRAELYAEMLSRYGFRHARFEIGWGGFDFDDENKLNAPHLASRLTALKRNGIRPTILINASSSQPCPGRQLRKIVAKAAAKWDRTITLSDANGIVSGYTGFEHVEYAAASPLIVALNGNVATLSKPLPHDMAAGTSLDLVTLKYRPFSSPGNPDYDATMKGWQTYALNVARIVRADLGTTGQPDGGFDMEIWNELSFGSDYLSIKNYYIPANDTNYLPATDKTDLNIYHEIVVATAAVADAHPDVFSGVQLVDGFSNTMPWPAGSTEPPRVTALSKHPYRPKGRFPTAAHTGTALNAEFGPATFVPSYISNFPEYFGTVLSTETIFRDLAPITTPVAGTLHGRFSRTINGKPDPVYVWITEVNNSPVDAQHDITDEAAEAIKAKTTARYFAFYLGKGVKQLDIYAANEKTVSFGMIRQNFRDYAETSQTYPSDDSMYVSPALRVTGRIVDKMKDGLDRSLGTVRLLHVDAIRSDHDDVIFTGDGTPAQPDLRAVDAFAFLPFQVNAHKFVIPYYVMTRDVTQAWPEDVFHINVSGFQPGARFSSYDPFTDTTDEVKAFPAGGAISVEVKASDTPRLLIVQEGGVK